MAVAVVLAGARSLAAIGEWTGDTPGQVLAALGVRRDLLSGAWRPPGEATVRRVLARIDADALARAIGGWLAVQQPPANPPSSTPAHGGGRSRSTARPCAAAATTHAHRSTCWRRWTHTTSAVLAQTDVAATTNEITGFQPLLEGLGPDWAGDHCRRHAYPARPRRLAGHP